MRNNHHIINRCKGGTSHPDNIVRLDEIKHNTIHQLFQNLSPHEQMLYLVSLYSTVFIDEYKTQLLEILTKPKEEIYKKGTYKHLKRL